MSVQLSKHSVEVKVNPTGGQAVSKEEEIDKPLDLLPDFDKHSRELLDFGKFDVFRSIKFIGKGDSNKVQFEWNFDKNNNGEQHLVLNQDIKEWDSAVQVEFGGDAQAALKVEKKVRSGLVAEVAAQFNEKESCCHNINVELKNVTPYWGWSSLVSGRSLQTEKSFSVSEYSGTLAYKLRSNLYAGLEFGFVDGIRYLNSGVQWKTKEYTVSLVSEGLAENLTASYAFKPVNRLALASSFNFDTATQARSLAFGLKKGFENNHSIEMLVRASPSKELTVGKNDISMKYNLAVNPLSSVSFSGTYDLLSVPKIGVQFSLGDLDV